MLGKMSENGKYGKYEMSRTYLHSYECCVVNAQGERTTTFEVCQPLNSAFFKNIF